MNRQDENTHSKSNISSPFLHQKGLTNNNHLTSKQQSGLKSIGSNAKANGNNNISNSKVISVSLSTAPSNSSKKLSNDEFIPPPPSSPYPGSDQPKQDASAKDGHGNTQSKLKRVESGQSSAISSSTMEISNQIRNESTEEQRLKSKLQYLEEANAGLQKVRCSFMQYICIPCHVVS